MKTLREIVNPQQATEIITDNSVVDRITRVTIKQKQNKSMYMHFYWVRDRVEQKHFELKCKPVHMNLGD